MKKKPLVVFYKLISKFGADKPELELYFDKAYITAGNGFTCWIAKNSGTWDCTELITGMSMRVGFKTLKEARKYITTLDPVMVLDCIDRAIKFYEPMGIEFYNKGKIWNQHYTHKTATSI